ncbi:MAG: DUF2795 domain-containing protein [Methanosarcinaceae archaeon]|nr:DUF2795 domain-containing protein [Methanosarcinaceae archaeon]
MATSESFEILPQQTRNILKEIKYPATNKDIIKYAKEKKVIPGALQEFGMLTDKTYENKEQVAKELEEIYIIGKRLKC